MTEQNFRQAITEGAIKGIVAGVIAILFAVLISVSVRAENTSLVYYFTFDDTMTSGNKAINSVVTADLNGTIGSAIVTGNSGISGQSYNFTSVPPNSIVNMSGAQIDSITGAAIGFEAWFKPTTLDGTTDTLLFSGTSAAEDWEIDAYNNGSIRCIVNNAAGTRAVAMTRAVVNVYSWTHIFCDYDGNNLRAYVNGTLERTTALTGNVRDGSASTDQIGAFVTIANPTFGLIDEVGIYNSNSSAAYIASRYSTPGYPGGSSSSLSNINLFNAVNGTQIMNFCGNYNGSISKSECTTNGSLVINRTGIFNISIFNVTNYFNVSISNYNLSGVFDIKINTTQALLNISAFRLFLNTSINSFNITNNKNTSVTTSNYILAGANNGTNNIKIDVPGNYSINFTCVVSAPLTTTSCNATGIYDSTFLIKAYALNGTAISIFNLTTINTTLGGTLYINTTSNTTIHLPLLRGYYYTFVISAPGFAYSNATRQATVYADAYNFSLFTTNSYYLWFLDEITRDLINQSLELELISDYNASNYTTSNSTLVLELLTPAEYDLRYRSSGWDERDYYTTLTDGSASNITLYLINSTESNLVVITVTDTAGNPVEGAIVKLLRYYTYCNCYEVVEMSKTTYSGQSLFNAEWYNGHYKIIVEYNGQTKFLSTTSENFVPDSTLTVSREIVIDLGDMMYEGYDVLANVGRSITFNNATGAISMTYNDPTGQVATACVVTSYLSGIRYLPYNTTCTSGSSGSVVVKTGIPQNNITFKYDAYVTMGGSETYTIESGYVSLLKGFDYGLLGIFLGIGVLVTIALIFSFSAVAMILSTVVMVIMLSMMNIMPFDMTFISGLVALTIGYVVFLMRS